jgi:hypothetical protein
LNIGSKSRGILASAFGPNIEVPRKARVGTDRIAAAFQAEGGT